VDIARLPIQSFLDYLKDDGAIPSTHTQNVIIIKEVSSKHLTSSDFNLNDEMLVLPKRCPTLVMVAKNYLSTHKHKKVLKNTNLNSIPMKFEKQI